MCDFSMLPKREQLLYQQLWKNKEHVEHMLECNILPRIRGKKPNSFFFEGDVETAELLKHVFDIQNEDMFDMKFKMATDGDGDEGRKIRTLHSSALCALLFFYNVTREHPLTLELDGLVIKFTRSVFEFKSPVIRNASNMDIVLYGKEEETGKRVVFLLESKFSEHYMSADSKLKGVSAAYRDNNEYSKPFYKEDFLDTLNLSAVPDTASDDKKFDLELIKQGKDNEYYIGGIKQMISHYVGMRNLEQNTFYGGKKDRCHTCMEEAIKDGADIILGEILFGDNVACMQAATDKYKEKYKLLAKQMNMQLAKDNISRLHVLEEDLSYSGLFRNGTYMVEEKILKYYFG